MKVLVVAPHPDDESIGCGGAISLHTRDGDCVVTDFITSGELALKHLPQHEAWDIREREAQRAAEVLGIAAVRFLRLPDWFLAEARESAEDALGPILDDVAPEVVYVPHAREWHPDHRAASDIVNGLLEQRPSLGVRVLSYEVWTPIQEYDLVEDITDVMVQKLRAVRCHRSQLTHFRMDRAAEGLNKYRGVLSARSLYAEVFESYGYGSHTSEHEDGR